MYKPPLPQDDEPYDIPEFSYPARQRRASQAGTTHKRRVPGDYRTDERPGEPKIKRASLLREQQEKQAQLEAAAREETGKTKSVRRPVPETRRSHPETGHTRAIRESGTSTRRPVQETGKYRAIHETSSRADKTREEADTFLMTGSRRSSGAYAPRKSASRPMQRGRGGTVGLARHDGRSSRTHSGPRLPRRRRGTAHPGVSCEPD